MIPRTTAPLRIVPGAKHESGSRERRRGCSGATFLSILRADQTAGAPARAGETAPRRGSECRTCSPTISSRRRRRSAPTPAGSSPTPSTPTRWARRARTCSSTRAWCAVAAGARTSPTSRTSTRWPRRSAACSPAPRPRPPGSAAPPSPSSPGTPRTCVWTRRPTPGCSTGRGTSPTEPIRRPRPRPSAGTGSSRRPSTSSSPASGQTTPPGCAGSGSCACRRRRRRRPRRCSAAC